MGLDMYLEGRTFIPTNWQHPEQDEHRDGFRVQGTILEIGYWRKHPNLHGFIVQTFANGVDECQEIELGKEQMEQIIAATKEKRLPHTEGFFFGQSDGSEDEETIHTFEKAIQWLEGQTDKEWRSVIYRASW